MVARYMLCDQPLVGAVREPPAFSPTCHSERSEARPNKLVALATLPLPPIPLACYLAHRGGGQLGYRRQCFPNPKRQVVNHFVRNLVGHRVLVIGGVVAGSPQEILGLPPRFYGN